MKILRYRNGPESADVVEPADYDKQQAQINQLQKTVIDLQKQINDLREGISQPVSITATPTTAGLKVEGWAPTTGQTVITGKAARPAPGLIYLGLRSYPVRASRASMVISGRQATAQRSNMVRINTKAGELYTGI